MMSKSEIIYFPNSLDAKNQLLLLKTRFELFDSYKLRCIFENPALLISYKTEFLFKIQLETTHFKLWITTKDLSDLGNELINHVKSEINSIKETYS